MSKEMVPSIPSEQEVGVVVTLVMARFWASSDTIEDASNSNRNMVYLYAFIWTQIRAVSR
jgi:hypothetical protein